jgi:DNA invertase Pin-like site-specific DNA recombinase
MMCLAIFAKKCDVNWEELEKDALRLQVVFDEVNSEQPFTVYETYKALEAYNEEYITFPRAAIERVTALAMPATKRNGRKQELHLRLCRANLEILNADNGKALQGRPKGSGEKKQQVYDWRRANPEGNKSQCARATGLSRSTVIKWWNWAPGAGEIDLSL